MNVLEAFIQQNNWLIMILSVLAAVMFTSKKQLNGIEVEITTPLVSIVVIVSLLLLTVYNGKGALYTFIEFGVVAYGISCIHGTYEAYSICQNTSESNIAFLRRSSSVIIKPIVSCSLFITLLYVIQLI